ncbi:MAG: hypothetical protein IPP94_12945 [Ignavibacteria bacterium]|nr:hypothetical protein [Ignavibacteria bacterium]
MRSILAVSVLCLLLAASTSLAQELRGDTLQPPPSDSSFVMKKSPLGAVIRSALLPGLGQLYNESYWKIPIVVGVGAFLVYGIVTEHANYADYRDQYALSISDLNPSGDLYLKSYREFYRDRRDAYAWWFAVVYLLQIADAFVDAHLYDFDVSDEVHASLQLMPQGRVGLQLRW